jgi:hypothetical protein
LGPLATAGLFRAQRGTMAGSRVYNWNRFFVAHLIEKSGRLNVRDVLIAVTLTAILLGGVARFLGQL